MSHSWASALPPRTEIDAPVLSAHISPSRRTRTRSDVVRCGELEPVETKRDDQRRKRGTTGAQRLEGSRLGQQSAALLVHPSKLGPRDKLSCSVIGAASFSRRPTSLDLQQAPLSGHRAPVHAARGLSLPSRTYAKPFLSVFSGEVNDRMDEVRDFFRLPMPSRDSSRKLIVSPSGSFHVTLSCRACETLRRSSRGADSWRGHRLRR